MDLTLIYAHSTIVSDTTCAHCDGKIMPDDSPEYVSFKLGKAAFSFHDSCFARIIKAMIQFHTAFIIERGKDSKRVN